MQDMNDFLWNLDLHIKNRIIKNIIYISLFQDEKLFDWHSINSWLESLYGMLYFGILHKLCYKVSRL